MLLSYHGRVLLQWEKGQSPPKLAFILSKIYLCGRPKILSTSPYLKCCITKLLLRGRAHTCCRCMYIWYMYKSTRRLETTYVAHFLGRIIPPDPLEYHIAGKLTFEGKNLGEFRGFVAICKIFLHDIGGVASFDCDRSNPWNFSPWKSYFHQIAKVFPLESSPLESFLLYVYGSILHYVLWFCRKFNLFYTIFVQGLDVKSTLRHICFHTLNRQLRDFLVSQW